MEAVETAGQHLIGQTVRHSSFGCGTIEELSGNVLTVNFPKGDKKFIYPEALEHFLKLEDSDSQREFSSYMAARRSEVREKKQKIREKENTRRKIRSMKIIPNSHTVFTVSREEVGECLERGWVSTGVYMSGFSQGRARTAGRIKPNSLCFITYLPKGADESERRLSAVFMAGENFYGEECTDGHILMHKNYRMVLEGSKALKIWDYAAAEDMPRRFGGLRFRYISDESALSILKAAAEKSGDPKGEDFISYFTRVNRLS